MSENRSHGGKPPVGPGGRPGGNRRGPMGGPVGGPGGHFGMPVEKPKNFKGTLKRLLKYLKPHAVTLIIVFLFTIGSTAFMVYAPMRSREAMNSLQQGVFAKMMVNFARGIENDGELKPLYEKAKQGMGVVLLQDAKTNDEKLAGIGVAFGLLQKMNLSAEQLDALQKRVEVATKISLPAGVKLSDISKMGAGQGDGKAGESFRQITDYIKAHGDSLDFEAIGQIMLQMLALYVLSSGFMFVMSYMMSGVSQNTVRKMRSEVNDKLARLPLKFFDSRTHGEILSRMTNDMDTIAQTLQQNLTQVISSIVQIVGYIIMMLTISPILTLIVMATLPLYIVATTFIAKASQKYYKAQQKSLGELSGHVEEMYGGHKVVKAFGHERRAVEKFTGINDELYNAGWRAQFVSGIMFPIMNFISNLGYVIICVIGGTYAAQKLLGLGDITTFIQYSRSFTQPIVQTSNIANVIQSTIACAERVFELLDETEQLPDKADAVQLAAPQGAVSFNDVRFGYTEDKILMEDMDIHVQPGQTIAIVGPTGAGKTTLVNLLMRFYEISDGSITVDCVDTRDMRRADLRHIFGMVLQDTWLFNGTIRENIAYGRDGATEEEIVAAAKAAHADRFIRTLPEGYDTVLNEEASNISQGQKQLLTIARAILANPPIIILDEATSSVDTRTEIRIQRAMHNLMKGRTSFVIAHRLSTIRDADLILVMNHGSIIETGTHESLLADKGFYHDMYMSQFTGAALEEQAV